MAATSQYRGTGETERAPVGAGWVFFASIMMIVGGVGDA